MPQEFTGCWTHCEVTAPQQGGHFPYHIKFPDFTISLDR